MIGWAVIALVLYCLLGLYLALTIRPKDPDDQNR